MQNAPSWISCFVAWVRASSRICLSLIFPGQNTQEKQMENNTEQKTFKVDPTWYGEHSREITERETLNEQRCQVEWFHNWRKMWVKSVQSKGSANRENRQEHPRWVAASWASLLQVIWAEERVCPACQEIFTALGSVQLRMFIDSCQSTAGNKTVWGKAPGWLCISVKS